MQIVQRHPDGGDVRLLLLGDGARKAALQADARSRGLTNVRFVDTVPKDQVARYWSLLDVSIIHLRRTELFSTVIPSKLFECMGMAIPVLHGVAGESARIVEREGAGITFEPEDAAALASLLLQLRADPALRLRLSLQAHAAAALYDRQALADRMAAILNATMRR
jgi:glycosyltransferase involved in cell wall biosynthesis